MRSLVLLFFLICSNAYAVTDCKTKIDSLYVGDGGDVYIIFEGEGGARILSTNPDQKNAYSLALAAFMAGKEVKVRYHTSGQSCSTYVEGFKGIYILK